MSGRGQNTCSASIAFTMLCLMATMSSAGVRFLCEGGQADTRFAGLHGRDSITILITDSGLGGLAVAADLARKVEQGGWYRAVTIVFANALPDGRGYNRMESLEEKGRVFGTALEAMITRFKPDAVLIACNTLSVVFPHTRQALRTEPPVLGIVDIGVAMLSERLGSDGSASVMIFGTETTVEDGAHRAALLRLGFAPERIVTQACPDLAGEIQQQSTSDAVGAMIDFYVGDAVRTMGQRSGRTIVGLCCTHYGYAAEQFDLAVRTATGRDAEIVDPDLRMADAVLPMGRPRRFPRTIVEQRIVSRVAVSHDEVESIARLIEQQSPGTASALRSYEHLPDLFPVSEPGR